MTQTALVFDFDGTLVDSNRVKRQAYFEIFQGLNQDATDVVQMVLSRNPTGNRYDTISRVVEHLTKIGCLRRCTSVPEYVRQYAEDYNKICEEYASTCRTIGEADETLPQLAEHYPLHINSATPQAPLSRIVARRGWTHWFQAVYGGPATKADILRRIATEGGYSRNDVFMIGDDDQDAVGAGEFGCRFIGIAHETSRFNTSPPYTINRIADLFTRIPEAAAVDATCTWPAGYSASGIES